MSKATTFYINIACSYHFITTTKKISFHFCTFARKLDKEIKETRKILYGMRLYMHITSQSFVQSYRSFETE